MIVCDGQIQTGGFGNEFFRLSKAFICSREFKLPFIKPYWPKNYELAIPDVLQEPKKWKAWLRRKYYNLTYKSLSFTEKEHVATGIVPIEEAFRTFLKRNEIAFKDNVIVTFPALYPGLECIENHGKYLKETLLENKWLAERLQENVRTLPNDRLLVGLHIRRGDFRSPLPLGKPWPKNAWNIQIPLEWYIGICQRLLAVFPKEIGFVVFSNSTDNDLKHLSLDWPIHHFTTQGDRGPADVVDMFILSMCDIIVSSVSWFSGWAVVFSESPFFWYTCAHGRPPWGGNRCYQYIAEKGLPTGLLVQARKILENKKNVMKNMRLETLNESKFSMLDI
jgi:hypothetical protein